MALNTQPDSSEASEKHNSTKQGDYSPRLPKFQTEPNLKSGTRRGGKRRLPAETP